MKHLVWLVGVSIMLGLSVVASAAPIVPIISGDGETWFSDLDSICGGPAVCSGTTVGVTEHLAWQDEALTSNSARWVSYAKTGIGPDGVLAPRKGSPENLDGQTPIMWIDEALFGTIGSQLSVTFWADDTADVYLNGTLFMAANFEQDVCAKGQIGCQPAESWTLNHTLTQSHNVLRIVTYQVGTGDQNNTNPFGVLYSGTYEPHEPELRQVPEPTSLMLFGVAVATAIGSGRCRRRSTGRAQPSVRRGSACRRSGTPRA